MTNYTDLTGLVGVALGTAVLSGLVLAPRSSSKRFFMLIVSGVFSAILLPLCDLPLAAYVRGILGDLSISSLLALGYVCGQRLEVFQTLASRRKVGALALIALVAIALYPLALGAGAYDPYRLGYGEPGFLAVALMLALAAIALRGPVVAVSISLAVLAWAVGWYESNNLWDYLIDPMLSIYAVCALFGSLAKAARSVWREGFAIIHRGR